MATPAAPTVIPAQAGIHGLAPTIRRDNHRDCPHPRIVTLAKAVVQEHKNQDTRPLPVDATTLAILDNSVAQTNPGHP